MLVGSVQSFYHHEANADDISAPNVVYAPNAQVFGYVLAGDDHTGAACVPLTFEVLDERPLAID